MYRAPQQWLAEHVEAEGSSSDLCLSKRWLYWQRRATQAYEDSEARIEDDARLDVVEAKTLAPHAHHPRCVCCSGEQRCIPARHVCLRCRMRLLCGACLYPREHGCTGRAFHKGTRGRATSEQEDPELDQGEAAVYRSASMALTSTAQDEFVGKYAVKELAREHLRLQMGLAYILLGNRLGVQG